MNWHDEWFDFSETDIVWVGGVAYNMSRDTVTYVGIWVGYGPQGEVCTMHFKDNYPAPTRIRRDKFGKLLALHLLLEQLKPMGMNKLRHTIMFDEDALPSLVNLKFIWAVPFRKKLLAKMRRVTVKPFDRNELPWSVFRGYADAMMTAHHRSVGKRLYKKLDMPV